jgi:hypothetical protein
VFLPKETHIDGNLEQHSQEFVKIYSVSKVLYPADKAFSDDKVKVWQEPDYSLEMVKEYHEKGISISPILKEY